MRQVSQEMQRTTYLAKALVTLHRERELGRLQRPLESAYFRSLCFPL